MAKIACITYAFHGFLKEQETVLKSAFAFADKWETPWELTLAADEANVVIVNISSEADYDKIESLKQELPVAEIVAFSPEKPPLSNWHLKRQPSGKAPVIEFSKLILKLTHVLKRKGSDLPQKPKAEPVVSITEPIENAESPPTLIEYQIEFQQEPTDMSSFFNQLDSILDSKANKKRKRFNES